VFRLHGTCVALLVPSPSGGGFGWGIAASTEQAAIPPPTPSQREGGFNRTFLSQREGGFKRTFPSQREGEFEEVAGVLITGPSGSGKSDLALRLIDQGAKLVADDQILVEGSGGRLFAHAPETIRGRMEVRHVGVVAVPFVEEAQIRLAIALGQEPARLPEPAWVAIAGVDLPLLAIKPFEASAPAKIRLAVQALAVSDRFEVTFPFPPR